jgi:deazaflavin-dependent oxidoreductase (nitroreductase family)
MLTTTGAKTGLHRSVTLTFFHDDDRIVIVASRAGTDRHPNWYYNLKANPDAVVLLHGYSGPYTSYEATGEERERLWATACGHFAGFVAYQKRAGDRQLPILVLTPQSEQR